MVVLINQLTHGDVFAVSEIFRNKTDLNFLKPMMQNLDEYRRIKDAALNANGVMDEDFNHMLETTSEQFKLLKINMKELVFPYLHKPIQILNEWLTKINKNPVLQKGLFTGVIGTIGLGLLLTGVGTAIMIIGKFVSAYGSALNGIRAIAPKVKFAVGDLFQFLQLRSLNIRFLNGQGGYFGAFISDITRLDKSMRESIKSGFKNFLNGFLNLPKNIMNSTIAFKDWTVAVVRGIPSATIKGLTAIKNGFLGIPGMIKNAVIAFRTFSLTLLTSPIGWIAVAIGAAALLIYKYWKPITAFFKGLWQGLREGLQPLMPLFKRIADAISPILTPIKALIDWIKKILKPVEDTGGAAEKMGVRFGKAIANIIIKITELITKVFECGKKIGDMLSNGILSTVNKTKEAIGKHAQIIRDHLPHSPAKSGPLKDLHKVKIIETVASTMRPQPLVRAMNKSLELIAKPTFKATPRFNLNPLTQLKVVNKIPEVISTSTLKSKQNNPKVAQNNQSLNKSSVINYNPTINITGNATKEDFKQMLKQHKDELLRLIKAENERKVRLAY